MDIEIPWVQIPALKLLLVEVLLGRHNQVLAALIIEQSEAHSLLIALNPAINLTDLLGSRDHHGRLPYLLGQDLGHWCALAVGVEGNAVGCVSEAQLV